MFIPMHIFTEVHESTRIACMGQGLIVYLATKLRTTNNTAHLKNCAMQSMAEG